MSAMGHLEVLKVLAGIAWADGIMDPREADALRRVISVAALSGEERAQAQSFLENPVELDLGHTAGRTAVEREGIYRAAVRCAAVDGSVDESERALLQRLGVGLALDPELVASINAESFGGA
jgi:uncharacterized membrane protein YebE (DUF533 family)